MRLSLPPPLLLHFWTLSWPEDRPAEVSVRGPHTARSQETAGATKHLCNLRTNVETRVRNLTNHLRT